jgi:hypothetical protein
VRSLAPAIPIGLFFLAAGAANVEDLPRTRLAVREGRFTVNGAPTFLLGASLYGALGEPEDALRKDLDDLRTRGFNWVRVWATWAAFGGDVSAVDADGAPREPYLGRLRRLVEESDRRGIVVDVTLSRGDGATGPARLQSLASHRRAVETIVTALRGRRNWYLDLGNERNIRDRRHVPFDDLRGLSEAARALDPGLLLTASHGGDIDRDELREYLFSARVDFVSPHRPRGAGSPAETEGRVRGLRGAMADLGRVVPVHLQEPFRRGYQKGWEPPADAFLADLRGALAGGAAGWCLHNGATAGGEEGRPRRSFDLREARLLDGLDAVEREVIEAAGRVVRAPRRSRPTRLPSRSRTSRPRGGPSPRAANTPCRRGAGPGRRLPT